MALDRTVVADIFRPVHLTCPKHSYRKTLLDEQEVNMSVVERNTKFDYIEVKMIDPDDPSLSQMKVYMTSQQLFQHCTTYFHFTEMKPIKQDIPVGNIDDNKKKIIHKVPPQQSQSPQPPNYSPSRIHQYLQSKSPQKVIKNESVDNGSPSKDPRAHLQDPLLQSFLHEEHELHEEQQKSGNQDLNKSFGESWLDNSGFMKATKSSSIDSKTDDNEMNKSRAQQQDFIQNNWNTRQTRLGLGASPVSNSNSASQNDGASGNNSNNHSFNSLKINGSPDKNDENDEKHNDISQLFTPWDTSHNKQDKVPSNHSNCSSNDTSSASIQNDEDDVHNITLPLNNQLNHENIQKHEAFHTNDSNVSFLYFIYSFISSIYVFIHLLYRKCLPPLK